MVDGVYKFFRRSTCLLALKFESMIECFFCKTDVDNIGSDIQNPKRLGYNSVRGPKGREFVTVAYGIPGFSI